MEVASEPSRPPPEAVDHRQSSRTGFVREIGWVDFFDRGFAFFFSPFNGFQVFPYAVREQIEIVRVLFENAVHDGVVRFFIIMYNQVPERSHRFELRQMLSGNHPFL